MHSPRQSEGTGSQALPEWTRPSLFLSRCLGAAPPVSLTRGVTSPRPPPALSTSHLPLWAACPRARRPHLGPEAGPGARKGIGQTPGLRSLLLPRPEGPRPDLPGQPHFQAGRERSAPCRQGVAIPAGRGPGEDGWSWGSQAPQGRGSGLESQLPRLPPQAPSALPRPGPCRTVGPWACGWRTWDGTRASLQAPAAAGPGPSAPGDPLRHRGTGPLMSEPRGDPRELSLGQEVLMQRWPRRCQLSLHPPAAPGPSQQRRRWTRPTHPWNSRTPPSEQAPTAAGRSDAKSGSTSPRSKRVGRGGLWPVPHQLRGGCRSGPPG